MSTVSHTISSLLASLKPGMRFAQPTPAGSGDAWLLTALATASGKTLVILTAEPLEAQRLAEEIPIFAPGLRVRPLPDWETLPYDSFSPHQDLISERLRTLHALMLGEVDVLTVPITTALYRLAPPSFLAAYTFSFKQKDKLDESALRTQLTLANYAHVSQVTAPGEFCVRGSLIDLFPMGSVVPYRIDLFDDEIESIRAFDIDTQRSLYPVGQVQLLPGREFPMDEAARNHFRATFREVFEGDPSRALPYRDMGNGIPFAGVEYYLPLFFEQTATLFDYLKTETIVVTLGDIDDAMRRFTQDTATRYNFLKSDRERPVLPPDALFLQSEALFEQLKAFPRLALTADTKHPDFAAAPDIGVSRRADDPLAKLRALLSHSGEAARVGRVDNLNNAQRIVLCTDSHGRRETIVQMLAEHGLAPDAQTESVALFLGSEAHFGITVAPLSTGFAVPAQGLLFLTENDLYPGHGGTARRGKRDQERASNVEAMVRDLSELREGDPVVHAQHGSGRYQGVMWTDGCACRFQSDANFGGLQGTFIIKGQHLQRAKKLCQSGQARFGCFFG